MEGEFERGKLTCARLVPEPQRSFKSGVDDPRSQSGTCMDKNRVLVSDMFECAVLCIPGSPSILFP